MERLAKRPLAVGKLAAGLSVTRPAVSQHLKVLRAAGLVTVRQQGTRNVYQIDPKGVDAMRTYLDRFWDRALAALKLAAESENQS
jgi:DNA-binding transcriptional ArsR family regulator